MKRKTRVASNLQPLLSKMSFASNSVSDKSATFIDFSDFVSSLKSKSPSKIIGQPMKRLRFDELQFDENVVPAALIDISNESTLHDHYSEKENSLIQTSNKDHTFDNYSTEFYWTEQTSSPNFTTFFRTYLDQYSKRKSPAIQSKTLIKRNKIMLGARLWSDQYAPLLTSQLRLNCPDLHSLISWMKLWNSRAEGVSHSINYDNASYNSSSNEDSSDSISSRHSWRSTAYLILGPTGCGKTALVYALANENGFKIFEMNSSSCRSRKEVLSQCSAVVSSQHVSKDCLSASFSSFQMTKVNASKISKRKSSKRSILNFFQPISPASSSLPKRRTKKSSANSKEGLTLSNKSLLLFDEVDVLFDSDRGFWNAVSDLLRIARKPIIMTASDPTVVHRIPTNFQVCRILPIRTEIVKPILSSICDLVNFDASAFLEVFIENLHTKISPALDVIKANTDAASSLISCSQFTDLRRAVNEMQWISSADAYDSPSSYIRSSIEDLVGRCSGDYPYLFSLTLNSCIVEKSDEIRSNTIAIDVFDGVFDAEPHLAVVSSANDDLVDKPQLYTAVLDKCCASDFNLPSDDCKELASDCLMLLSKLTDLEAVLDSYSNIAKKLNSINALHTANDSFLVKTISQSELDKESSDNQSYSNPFSTTHSLSVGISFTEGCSECFSGINTLGSSKALPYETFWRKTVDLIARRQLKTFETRLLSLQPIDSGESSAHLSLKEPTSLGHAMDIATCALIRLDSIRDNGLLFQSPIPKRDFAIDYLPSLSSVAHLETMRHGLSEQRRFLHYFDKIGLCFSEDLRRSL